jgi:hypothetical protein
MSANRFQLAFDARAEEIVKASARLRGVSEAEARARLVSMFERRPTEVWHSETRMTSRGVALMVKIGYMPDFAPDALLN